MRLAIRLRDGRKLSGRYEEGMFWTRWRWALESGLVESFDVDPEAERGHPRREKRRTGGYSSMARQPPTAKLSAVASHGNQSTTNTSDVYANPHYRTHTAIWLAVREPLL